MVSFGRTLGQTEVLRFLTAESGECRLGLVSSSLTRSRAYLCPSWFPAGQSVRGALAGLTVLHVL